VLKATGLALESLALSAGSNGELVLCLKEWRAVQAAAARGDGGSWALRAKAVADRLRMSLAVRAHPQHRVLATAASFSLCLPLTTPTLHPRCCHRTRVSATPRRSARPPASWAAGWG
jgi:hypothetical protein